MRKLILIITIVLSLSLAACNIEFSAIINPSLDTVEVGSSWTDPGCTTTGTQCIKTNGEVDIETIGEYHIEYTAQNSKGETLKLLRVVHVIDAISPVLHLNPGIDSVKVGTQYIDTGCFGLDNYDENISCEVDTSSVDSSIIGEYLVVYHAVDSSGNEATITRIVVVYE